MKKILILLLIIISIVLGARLGVFDETEDLQKTRANYYEIYGEKAKDFVFSK